MPRRAARCLDVWLYGTRVAILDEPSRFRYRLRFTEEAFDTFGSNARILSIALPFTEHAVRDTGPTSRPVSAWLEGLLPEGNIRKHLASTLRVESTDKMSLLAAVGPECAGAVQFLSSGLAPGEGSVRPLTDEELQRLIVDLPTLHNPEGTAIQASLAGIQDKVLLTRLPGQRWGWPQGGAASTHLIKPEPTVGGVLEHLVQTETWALGVARTSGISAANATLDRFEERAAIVVERFDRREDGSRIHQEDFTQILSLEPDAKYESTREANTRGTRLSRVAALAGERAASPYEFRRRLLEAVTFNVIIGNGDAHSKNYSILIQPSGEVSLAPLYDAAPVMYLNPRFKQTGHVIASRTNIDWVDLKDLVAEGRSWGLDEKSARSVVTDTVERVHEAIDRVDLPEGAEFVRERLEDMWLRRSWRPNGSTPSPRVAASTADRHSQAPRAGRDDDRPGDVWVEPYMNARGTHVQGHHRRRPSPRT